MANARFELNDSFLFSPPKSDITFLNPPRGQVHDPGRRTAVGRIRDERASGIAAKTNPDDMVIRFHFEPPGYPMTV